MNFKKEYENAFSEIKADEDFKKSLIQKMNDENDHKKKPAYIGVLAAAAIMIFVVGAGFVTGVLSGRTMQEPASEENHVVQNNTEPKSDVSIEIGNELAAEQQMSDAYVELDISGLSWYGKAESDEELLSVFVSLISGDTLEKLYCTEEKEFDETALLNAKDTDALVKYIKSAACTEEEFAGESKYYKAVFEDGLTIKFWISDIGYLKLQDTGTVYKIL